MTLLLKQISLFKEVAVKKRTKPEEQMKVALKNCDTVLKKCSCASFLRSDIQR